MQSRRKTHDFSRGTTSHYFAAGILNRPSEDTMSEEGVVLDKREENDPVRITLRSDDREYYDPLARFFGVGVRSSISVLRNRFDTPFNERDQYQLLACPTSSVALYRKAGRVY